MCSLFSFAHVKGGRDSRDKRINRDFYRICIAHVYLGAISSISRSLLAKEALLRRLDTFLLLKNDSTRTRVKSCDYSDRINGNYHKRCER